MSIRGGGRIPPMQTKNSGQCLIIKLMLPFDHQIDVVPQGGGECQYRGWWMVIYVVHNPKSLCFVEELPQYLCN